MYPYNKVYPPFTPDRIKLIKMLVKYTSFNQSALGKGFIYLVILGLIVVGIVKGNINRHETIPNIKKAILMIIEAFKIAAGVKKA